MAEISVVSFTGKKDPNGKAKTMPWDELAKRLSRHLEGEEKDGWGWNAAVYRDGKAYRKDENIEALTCLVLDVDDGTPLEALQGLLDPYEWVAYTTYSHTPEHPKYRVVLPLARPVQVEEWEQLWFAAVVYLAAGRIDSACKDPSRFYLSTPK